MTGNTILFELGLACYSEGMKWKLVRCKNTGLAFRTLESYHSNSPFILCLDNCGVNCWITPSISSCVLPQMCSCMLPIGQCCSLWQTWRRIQLLPKCSCNLFQNTSRKQSQEFHWINAVSRKGMRCCFNFWIKCWGKSEHGLSHMPGNGTFCHTFPEPKRRPWLICPEHEGITVKWQGWEA